MSVVATPAKPDVVPVATSQTNADEGTEAILQNLLHKETLKADKIFLWLLWAHFPFAAVFVPYFYGTMLEGTIVGGLLCAIATISYVFAKGTLTHRMLNGLIMANFSALFIALELGRIEMHFHIFVGFAFLAIYKDWRIIPPAVVLIALHHAGFNYCQQEDITIFGFKPIIFNYGNGWGIVVMHALFLIAEAAILSYFAILFRKQFIDITRMNVSLEKKVDERTAELRKVNNTVSVMLDSLKLSVFKVNEKGEILEPASAYSKEIFDGNVVQQNLFNVLFKDLEEGSEQHARVRSTMTCVYGEDSLQWDLEEQNLPRRVIITDNNNNSKTLSVNYSPIWDDSEQLSEMLLSIEDRTALEQLEREKERGEENIRLIQEMSTPNMEDLSDFLQSGPKQAERTLLLLRDLNGNAVEHLGEAFRHLHTIKGNARIYGLLTISNVVHDVETRLSEVLEEVKQDEAAPLSEEKIEELKQGVYEILTWFRRYSEIGQKVFRFENDYMLNRTHEIFTYVYQIDRIFSDAVSTAKLKSDEEKLGQLCHWLKNGDTSELNRLLHGLRGNLRIIEDVESSDLIFAIETAVKGAESHDPAPEKVVEAILTPYLIIRKKLFKFQAGAPKAGAAFDDSYVAVAKELFQFGQDKADDRKRQEYCENLWSIASASGRMPYLTNLFRRLRDGDGDTEALIQSAWNYLGFCMNVDCGLRLIANEATKVATLLDAEHTDSRALMTELNNLKSVKTYLISFLSTIARDDQDLLRALATIKQAVGGSFEKALACDKKQLSDLLQKLVNAELNLYDPSLIHFQTTDDRSYFEEILKKLFVHDPIGSASLLITDCSAFLSASVMTSDDVRDFESQMIDVTAYSLNRLKDTINTALDQQESDDLINIQNAADRLLELPVKASLKKFRAMTQRLAGNLGKKVAFWVTGDNVTLARDKIYLLQDALVHIVRNSIDHGIELPEERLKLSKSEAGNITINLKEEVNGHVTVSVEDDGRGIDCGKVSEAALKKGLMTKDELAAMSEPDIQQLIFMPNLSTKEEVTELSGRGVGMDVVKVNIEKLGGSVAASSESGVGTTQVITI